MAEKVDHTTAQAGAVLGRHRHPAILRASSLVVATILALLMITAVVPPIVADQSDRAVVDAPVTLLTAPIDGEVDTLSARLGQTVRTGDTIARVSNLRVDRGTLISLEDRVADAREKLQATQAKAISDRVYLASLDGEISHQIEQFRALFQSQIIELRALVAESDSLSGEKKALVERQTNMVQRNAASKDMLKPTEQQYAATLHKADAERAKLNQKIAQLDALEKGVYVGDDLVALGTLAQKRRDIDLDAKRLEIEQKELAALIQDKQRLIDAERERLDRLTEADIQIPRAGKILNVTAAPGRHVNAGDAVASLVDCDKRFIVAIFSYRQGQSMAVGSRVHVDGASFGSGIVSEILPKTSDKADERFAIPFPQTERRELYAIVEPDAPLTNASNSQTTADYGRASTCRVGQWVTVTKDNGIVPSMSVTWRRLEALLTSWGNSKAPSKPVGAGAKQHEAGDATLAAPMRSAQTQQSLPDVDERLSRTKAVVSR